MKAGRELDALVAEKVMGLCIGKMIYVSDEELTAKFTKVIHDDFVSNFGEEPNKDWLESEVEQRVREEGDSDYPPKRCEKCENGPHRPIPAYSTSIADAWLVVEKMRAGKYMIGLHTYQDRWICVVSGKGKAILSYAAETAPLAICLAALKACGVKFERDGQGEP